MIRLITFLLNNVLFFDSENEHDKNSVSSSTDEELDNEDDISKQILVYLSAGDIHQVN